MKVFGVKLGEFKINILELQAKKKPGGLIRA